MARLIVVTFVMFLFGCALRQHGVQRVRPGWTLPVPYVDVCMLTGDRAWIDGAWQVRAACPDGYRLFDERTKRVTTFVAWSEFK